MTSKWSCNNSQYNLCQKLKLFSFYFLLRLLPVFFAFTWSGDAFGDDRLSGDFYASRELSSYIEFWKSIFTQYSKYQLIFHDREYPELIYSVLDLSDLKSLKEPEFKKRQSLIEKTEVEAIRDSLLRLGYGEAPQSRLEMRIHNMITKLTSKGATSAYHSVCIAASNSIRTQIGMKEKFAESVMQAGKYLSSIEQIFSENGLPLELARIPFIESSFNYHAVSSVGASGIWQFMRSTGKKYMRIDDYVDERRDPIISSRSAAKYLKRAYDVLETWPLAITSYNHGVSGTYKATRQVGSKRLIDLIRHYKGQTFGFASKNFYVSFLAALDISKNYRYYYPALIVSDPVKFDEVRLLKPINYEKILTVSGLSKDSFDSLNPSLLAPIKLGNVNIPAGTYIKLAKNTWKDVLPKLGGGELIAIGGAVISSVISTPVQPVSSNRNITNRTTHKITNLANSSSHKDVSKDSLAKNSPVSKVAKSYRVKKGDTLSSIANKHGLSLSELKAKNTKKTNNLKIGEVLLLK